MLQVFGVLYTVSKEKHVSPLFVAVRLLLDVLQLWLLIVQPQNGFMVRSGKRSPLLHRPSVSRLSSGLHVHLAVHHRTWDRSALPQRRMVSP